MPSDSFLMLNIPECFQLLAVKQCLQVWVRYLSQGQDGSSLAHTRSSIELLQKIALVCLLRLWLVFCLGLEGWKAEWSSQKDMKFKNENLPQILLWGKKESSGTAAVTAFLHSVLFCFSSNAQLRFDYIRHPEYGLCVLSIRTYPVKHFFNSQTLPCLSLCGISCSSVQLVKAQRGHHCSTKLKSHLLMRFLLIISCPENKKSQYSVSYLDFAYIVVQRLSHSSFCVHQCRMSTGLEVKSDSFMFCLPSVLRLDFIAL